MNRICERFHKMILQEFYQVAFRKKLYGSIDALQADLDEWMHHYNHEHTHQGKMCCGKTPIETKIPLGRLLCNRLSATEGKETRQEKLRTELDLTDATRKTANCRITSEPLTAKKRGPYKKRISK